MKCQPRCAICNDPLAGSRTVSLEGRRIHSGCFRCDFCSASIADGYYKEGPGKYSCSDCHAGAWQAREEQKDADITAAEQQLKAGNARRYRLSWREELVPCSRRALRSLGVKEAVVPNSELICICRDPFTGQVTCAAAPRWVPQAAVNISYFAAALQILRHHGREPQFSLDPKDPHDISGRLQVKRFIPSWLAATVVGEVLFQADYELKELCIGERQLPELPSPFQDRESPTQDEPRAARQWFVVRRAGVTVAADGALVPLVDMGVEARCLVPSPKGYVDAAYTDPREPMVLMAQSITERFPEVARRLPAVAELVHFAKAMVLARYLLESGSTPDEAVLSHCPMPQCPEGTSYAMEIPTLRTRRRSASVSRRGARLVMQRQERSMHGGVDLRAPVEKVPSREVKQPLLRADDRRAPLPLFAYRSAAMAA